MNAGQVNQQIEIIQKKPWLMISIAIGAVCIIGYLAWSKWGPQSAKNGEIAISVPQAKEIATMETTTVTVPLKVIKNKQEAVKKLGLPEAEASDPKEALLTAAAIKANRNGAKTVVFVNMSGKSRTDIIYNKAPWFALERTNYFGVGIGYSTADGRVGKLYYKRDVAQVKGVYIQLSADAIGRPDAVDSRKGELIGWVNFEYRR